MTSTTAAYCYQIDRTAGKIIRIIAYIMIALAVIWAIGKLLAHLNIHFSFHPTLLLIYQYAWYACLGACALCILLRICLSPFVKSEEEEDFEKKVEYILEQKKAQKPKVTPPADYTPLRNLSDKQEQQVLQLLRDLPSHHRKADNINLALVAQYLTALEKLGKANLTDKHNLRLWLEQVTGKQVPAASQFNEAIPSTTKTKVLAAQKAIEKVL